MPLCNAVHHGQPHAGAIGFSGKKRIDRFVNMYLMNTDAGIQNGNI